MLSLFKADRLIIDADAEEADDLDDLGSDVSLDYYTLEKKKLQHLMAVEMLEAIETKSDCEDMVKVCEVKTRQKCGKNIS